MADDWFRAVRDEVAAVLAAHLEAAGVAGVRVAAMDQADPTATDLPAVVVSYNASEQSTGGTNARDDYGYPVLVTLHTVEGDNGVGGGADPPGLTATRFRQLVRERFHHRRAVAVDGIDCFLCEYDPQGAVIDPDGPAFQKLWAAAVVTVYARVPRGG